MCIILLTTKHPDYALIIINNRDEFIVRPTSRPHWWTPHSTPKPAHQKQPEDDASPPAPQPPPPEILSSRDLNRPERGTWLGMTRTGRFAGLTNYREASSHDASNPVHGLRSRGAIVSAWLGADPRERTHEFVERILSGAGVKGVGGFSLICGQLRPCARGGRQESAKQGGADGGGGGGGEGRGGGASGGRIDPLAVISNRSEHPSHVPWICRPKAEANGDGECDGDAAGDTTPLCCRGETHGLSNTTFDADEDPWPKVSRGKDLLDAAVARHSGRAGGAKSEDDLLESLFAVLDTDTLPRPPENTPFEDYIPLLKHSIFVPALGSAERRIDMAAWAEVHAAAAAAASAAAAGGESSPPVVANSGRSSPGPHARAETTPVGHQLLTTEEEQITGFMTGLYGTQRQTVILVDWQGNVRYMERALWDEAGRSLERGKGDVTFRFKIDGWDDEHGQSHGWEPLAVL